MQTARVHRTSCWRRRRRVAARGVAQQPMQAVPIGLRSLSGTVSQTLASRSMNAFRDGLRELGYIEGREHRIRISALRTVTCDRLRRCSRPNWSRLRVDVIVALDPSALLRREHATHDDPDRDARCSTSRLNPA